MKQIASFFSECPAIYVYDENNDVVFIKTRQTGDEWTEDRVSSHER